MNHTRYFWNLVSGSVFLSFLALIVLPGSRSFGDSIGGAMLKADFDPVAAPEMTWSGSVRAMRKLPVSMEMQGKIRVGTTLSDTQISKLAPVPRLISRQFLSPDGHCYFRFHEGRVLIIHAGTNRVLGIEPFRPLIEL